MTKEIVKTINENEYVEILQQAVAALQWGHNLLLLDWALSKKGSIALMA